jgi:hypothetical protein
LARVLSLPCRQAGEASTRANSFRLTTSAEKGNLRDNFVIVMTISVHII